MLKYILILLILTPTALAEDLYFYDTLLIEGNLYNPVSIQPKGANPSVQDLVANLTWVPKEDSRQTVKSFSTNPSAAITNGYAVFNLPKPAVQDISFDLSYTIQTNAKTPKLTEKVPFPLKKLSAELSAYTQPTETINTNDEIKSLALQLAGDSNDAYEVVTNIAAWTKTNIEYDLSTISVEASQPSTWVLENREGVCDEITNLFISFVRSLGIPAKFVTGLSYTTSPLFDESWGAHGWAEVYFPGVGWVPFDVTYGQIGWVDATHIKFSEGVDSSKYASSYTWKGRDVQIKPQGMDLDASILNIGAKVDPLVEITLTPIETNIGFGSYNVIQATVHNPNTFYVADELILGQTQGVNIVDPTKAIFSLAPKETKTFYWRVFIGEDLDANYQYSFPFTIITQRNATATTIFSAQKSSSKFSASWAEKYLNLEEKTITDQNTVFNCVHEATTVRPNQEIKVVCSLQGKDESLVSFCSEEKCQEIIVQENIARAEFIHSFKEQAVYSLSYTATTKDTEYFSLISVDVIEQPSINVQSIEHPTTLDYDKKDVIHFEVSQNSINTPKLARITLSGGRVENSWDFDELIGTKVFDVTIPGNALENDETEFTILVVYYDEKGNKLETKESFNITMGSITWWQKITLWLLNKL